MERYLSFLGGCDYYLFDVVAFEGLDRVVVGEEGIHKDDGRVWQVGAYSVEFISQYAIDVLLCFLDVFLEFLETLDHHLLYPAGNTLLCLLTAASPHALILCLNPFHERLQSLRSTVLQVHTLVHPLHRLSSTSVIL